MITAKSLKNLDFYTTRECFGDHWASDRVDWYLTERKKVLGYGGKSAINKKAFSEYENELMSASHKFWWSNADDKYLRDLMWLFRRLKKGLSKEEEKNLVADFILRLPYHRAFVLRVSTKFAEFLKKRIGE